MSTAWAMRAAPGSTRYLDSADHPDADTVPGPLLVRPDGPLFFANAGRPGHP